MEAPSLALNTSINDADGNPHRWDVTPHNPTEGQRIVWTLLSLGAEPVGRLAQATLTGFNLSELGTLRSLLDDPSALGRLAQHIDLAQVGGDIKRSVASMPMDALVRDILLHAVRDGRQLRDPTHFNDAFRRNYREMLLGLWEVVKFNRFLGL